MKKQTTPEEFNAALEKMMQVIIKIREKEIKTAIEETMVMGRSLWLIKN